MLTLQLCVILACLLLGTRFGGMGLGLISGIGLFILCFVFKVAPSARPHESLPHFATRTRAQSQIPK